MDKSRVTPKDFFLWAGAMVALYWSVVAFIFLLFDYINYAFPDPLTYLSANPYDSGIGHEMASIVVMFPLYVVLMWMIRSDIARDQSRRDIWVRRWALILTLFVAGATIAGDLISLLGTLFTGNEMTTGFLLKSALLLLVAAGGFMHFIADYWGYWERNEARKRAVCYTAGLLAALAVIAGFVMFGAPWQARQYRFDEQRVMDLQEIQSRVINYYQAKQELPNTLAALSDTISGFSAPVDPANGSAYAYKVTGPLSFELCATFSAPTVTYGTLPTAPAPVAARGAQDSWYHEAGEQCFQRVIDPALYPPLQPSKAQ